MTHLNTIKRTAKKGLTLLLIFSTLLLALLSFSTAWLYSGETDHSFNGHVILGYFDPSSGTGESADSPYVISSAKHLYNLSWLQNVGAFTKKTYFELKGDVDMAGCLSGIGVTSGAIPPIGTADHPFIGEFNGNGAIIQNLWISTDESDWYEKPASYEQYQVGSDVGLFGYIGEGANVSNFYLENVEVTNTVTNANLGIIAGYVDGNVSNIGVKNAKFSFKNSSPLSVSSEYSLIGYVTENVVWEDLPSNPETDGPGGDLIVNPSVDQSASQTTGKNNAVEIPGSEGRAYYVGSLVVASPSPQPTATSNYKYTASAIVFNGSKVTYTADLSTTEHLVFDNEAQLEDLKIEQDFIDIFGGTIYALYPKQSEKSKTVLKPDFSKVTGSGTYPHNSVWFKPVGVGNCSIAFSRQSSNANETMSIYRYKRDGDGAIVNNSLQEIILNMPRGQAGGVANGSIVYFSLSIGLDDLGYEYVIGASSVDSGGTAGFVFLKLAGTDEDNGPQPNPDDENYRALRDIDFVNSTEVDLTVTEMHKSVLAISGTQSDVGAIYFDEAGGLVLYLNDSSLEITEQINEEDRESSPVTSEDHEFPSRLDKLPQQVP